MSRIIMPISRALVALSFAVTLVLPAYSRAQSTVQTLEGTMLRGEVTNITDTKVSVKVDGKEEQKLDVAQVVQINFKPLPGPSKDPYIAVELTDGTALRCKNFTIKKKDVSLTLLGGKELKVSLEMIQYILKDAHDANLAKQFKEKFLGKPHSTDLVIRKNNNDVLNGREGTFGDADEKGTTIEFTTKVSGEMKKINASFANLQGMMFSRTGPSGDVMKPALCKLYDTERNEIMVLSISKSETGYAVGTPAGAKFDLGRDLVARLDYSKGKLTFLSDLNPSEVKETSTDGAVDHYRRDKPFTSETPGSLKLRIVKEGAKEEVKVFRKGLALHSRTELEYDLKGEYREFKAIIGIDASLDSAEPTVVKILGDGKELYKFTLQPDVKKQGAQDVTLSVKNVIKLRLIVQSAKFLDLGSQALLAEARVSK
jgi:hypothetical protein